MINIVIHQPINSATLTDMQRLNIYVFNIILLITLQSCSESKNALHNSQVSQPNIIILLADDLGYGDLSCYGSQSIETPNIDALAREGMRFTRFYTGSAVCTPSRACLLTGKFPLRYDIRRHFTDNEEHLPESSVSVTLAELLKKEGYHTAHIGKWHLGGLRPKDYEARTAGKKANPGPLQHGFAHSLTSIEGAPIRPELINQYTEGNNPFFLNLWFDVPHTPYEPAPEPHLSKYEKLGATGDQLLFRSMVSHLDANIGRLIQHLKQKGIFDNTIFVFASDNSPASQGSPGPFKGGKTDLHEGGIRVPMFAVWPNHIPSNQYSFQTVHMADIFPTLCEAADIEIQNLELDGKSMLAKWKNNTYQSREALFWQMDLYKHFQNQGPKPMPYATSVIIQGKWKMLADGLEPTELFDLEADHRELYNLLGEYPDLEQALSKQLHSFLQAPRDSSGFRELSE